MKQAGETVWLSQEQIAELFGKDRTVIGKHIAKIFKDEELDEDSNVQKMHITQFKDGELEKESILKKMQIAFTNKRILNAV